MWTLVVRDLQHRALRFAVVVVATAVVFTLLLLMTGLVAQFEREPHEAVARFGADAWVVREGVSGPFTTATTLDKATAAAVRAEGRTDPVIVVRHSMRVDGQTHDVVLIGARPGGLGSPPVSDGAAAAGDGEAVVASSAGVAPGAAIEIGARPLEVTGTVDDATALAGMPLVFVPLQTARDLAYRGQPLATALIVDGQVTAMPEGLQLLSNADVAEDAKRPLERAISSLHLVRVLLWLVAAMIVGAVVYLSALERQRDFAVLKAVGASTRALLGGVAAQGALIALSAAVAAAVLAEVVAPAFPLDVFLTGRTLVQLPLVAVFVALAASAAALRRVHRADPAAAFAGPGG